VVSGACGCDGGGDGRRWSASGAFSRPW
jgi:hypothetical protein